MRVGGHFAELAKSRFMAAGGGKSHSAKMTGVPA
jgi:hypothetical protein